MNAIRSAGSPYDKNGAPCVVAVSLSPRHSFTKAIRPSITLVEGIGIEGDAHAGVTVKHRSRVKVDPTQPNLRQVHLVHTELLDMLVSDGFDVFPGAIGENVTTSGLDLLGLPTGAVLSFPSGASVEVTGLRNPCIQLDDYQQGLTAAVLRKHADGRLERLSGVMAVVRAGGEIRPGDAIGISLPAEPHRPLEKV